MRPSPLTERGSAGRRQQLGDLDGVEGGALAEVVVADEQGEAAPVGHALVADGSARRSSGPGRRPAAASGCRSARRPGRAASSSVARSTDSGRANSALIDSEWPVNTGTRTHVPDTSRSGMPRILRLSLRSFCSSSVSNEPSSTSLPANGSTLKAIGRANFSGAGNTTASPSWVSAAAWSTTWRTCLSSSSTPASPAPDTAWYVRGDEADEPGLVVQRLEHRHRRHRRAVRVGDDPLAGVGDGLRVDLGHDERHVGVHAEGRGVVDDGHAGGGEPRRQLARRRGAGREQGDVETGRIGDRGVLDGDLAVAATAASCRPTGPRRRSAARRPGSPARRAGGA